MMAVPHLHVGRWKHCIPQGTWFLVSNLDPLSEVLSIWIDLDRIIECCVWGQKRRSMHILIVSALLQATHCVPHICSSREAIWWLAGVQIWCYGSCVEVWPLEVNMHTWTCFTQCSVDAIDVHWIHIEQFGYWTSLNLDLVWTDLLSTEHEAWSKNNLQKSLSDRSLLKDVRNLFGTITQTHHVRVMFRPCSGHVTEL